MTLYKTKNGQMTGFVPGVGEIVDGKIESPVKLEGNFEKVTEAPQTPAPAAPVASPTPAPTPQVNQVENTQNTEDK